MAAINPTPPPPRKKRVLRLRDVEDYTGLKRPSVYRLIALGLFPAQVPIGIRSVGWLEEEILSWLESRIAERDAKNLSKGGGHE
jgi:prophage regulatory protein